MTSLYGDEKMSSDPSHPIYAIVRLTIYMSALTILLVANASDFDATEIRTLVQMFLVAAGAEGAIQLIKTRKKNGK